MKDSFLQSKIARHTLLILAVAFMATSCTLAKLSKVARQVEVVRVAKVELKGMTGLRLDVELVNASQYPLSMEEATITLKMEGKEIATLTQIGEAISPAYSEAVVSTMWRIESIEAMTTFLLASKLSKGDLSSLTIDFTAHISAMEHGRTISAKDLDISNLMGNFAL